MPVVNGTWKITAYQFLLGPILVSQLTDNINEAPAIWCLMSIGIVFLVMKTPLRGWMRVHHWLFWGKAANPT